MIFGGKRKSEGKFGKSDGKDKGFGKKTANQFVYCYYCSKHFIRKKCCKF